MKDKTQKSHLADYIDSMMKTKSDEFHSPTTLERETPSNNQKITIALVKPSNSASSIDTPTDNSSGEAIDHRIGETNGKTIDVSNGSSIVQSMKESMTQSIDEPIATSIGQSTYKTLEYQDNQCRDILLNSTQYLLFYSIKEINGRLTNLAKISLQLGISNNTLKSALKKIIEKKAILYHGRDNRLGLQGFRAHALDCPISLVGTDLNQIKRKLRLIDFDAMCLETSTNNPFGTQPVNHRMLHPLDQPSDESSSSININNKELLREIEDYFELNPDLEFWKNEKLPPQIVLKWITEFNIHPDVMILYLSRCAYDVTQNKKVPSKTSVTNFFYGCLKKLGCYLNPMGYLTIEERRLSELKKIIEEKERILRETEELERRNEKAELELNFQKTMTDKKSDLYQQCYSSINQMFRENESSPGFRAAMKNAYEKIITAKPLA